MKPLATLLNEYLSGRAKTRLYGILAFWIIVLHIQIIFTALFESQSLIYQKTGMLKGEYISAHYFKFDSGWWWYQIITFLASILLTWLMIYILPRRLLIHAYRREIEDEYERKKMKARKENELERERHKVAETKLKTIDTESEVAEKEENLENKEIVAWEKDFDKFKKLNMYNDFDRVISSLFEHYGNIHITNLNGQTTFKIPTDILAYTNSNGLVDFSEDRKRIQLTEKGKYFVKRYQEDEEP